MIRKFTPPSSIKRQEGWTFWSLLFTLSVVVFFAYVGMQLVPVYSANENIVNAMARSVDDVDLLKVNRTTVVRNLDAQLYLDGSHNLLDYKTDLVVKRNRQVLTIETHYQREIPMFFNIYMLVKFDNVLERELSGN